MNLVFTQSGENLFSLVKHGYSPRQPRQGTLAPLQVAKPTVHGGLVASSHQPEVILGVDGLTAAPATVRQDAGFFFAALHAAQFPQHLAQGELDCVAGRRGPVLVAHVRRVALCESLLDMHRAQLVFFLRRILWVHVRWAQRRTRSRGGRRRRRGRHG